MIASHHQCIVRAMEEISSRYRDRLSFVDLGSGGGDRTVLFQSPGRVLHGVDIQDWREEKYVNAFTFHKLDFTTEPLPFASDSISLVHSFDVIEHIKDPLPFMREAWRILEPGGIFILGTPNRHRILGLILILLGLRKFPYPPNPDHAHIPFSMHEHEYTAPELSRLSERTGFRVMKIHRLFYGMTSGFGFERFFNFPLAHNLILELEKI